MCRGLPDQAFNLLLTWNLKDWMPNTFVIRYQIAGQLQNLHTAVGSDAEKPAYPHNNVTKTPAHTAGDATSSLPTEGRIATGEVAAGGAT